MKLIHYDISKQGNTVCEIVRECEWVGGEVHEWIEAVQQNEVAYIFRTSASSIMHVMYRYIKNELV